MVGNLYRTKKCFTPRAMLYLYKSQITPKMDYFCCNSFQPRHSLKKKRLRGFVGDKIYPKITRPQLQLPKTIAISMENILINSIP